MRMKNPPDRGRIVRQECIELFDLTIIEAAKHLTVTNRWNTISRKFEKETHLILR
jgi:plasmid maintenance system antidote protein VapI